MRNGEYCIYLIKNPYHDGLRRTTQTLDHVVVVHILIGHPRKSQMNEYNGIGVMFYFVNDENLI